ncbi:transposase, partial [Nocardia gipuzkoensis]
MRPHSSASTDPRTTNSGGKGGNHHGGSLLRRVGRSPPVAAQKKYPDELKAEAIRIYRDADPKPTIRYLAQQLGVHHEALRYWIRQA